MAELTLYHASPSRSSIVRWMLEELGEPYDIHLLSLAKGEQSSPAYLAINPMGKVPALKHGNAVITEGAAICTYLADEFPHAGLNIPVGDPRRGPYRREERSAGRHDASPRRIGILEPGPYLMGEQFTVADVVVGSMLRWGMMFDLLPKRPEFVSYVGRLEQRPALQRATALDQELAAA